jgi:integrase
MNMHNGWGGYCSPRVDALLLVRQRDARVAAIGSPCRRAGVRSIRLHDLRHSCATLLFAMGVEAATVQRILRHSSISVTTGTYVDVIEQVQRSAVAGMDSLLNPAQ